MSPLSLTDTLASYVPRLIQKRILLDPAPIDSPVKETFETVVLFTDISGFTALTEQLAIKGASGTESLAHLINSYFEQLIGLIHASGGDIIKFAGDALIAAWPLVDEAPTDATRRDMALRVAACSLKIREKLDNVQIEDIPLRLKLAISAGEVTEMHVGGVFNHWEFLVVGDPLVELGRANQLAKAGDVLLAPSVLKLIRKESTGTALDFESGSISGKGLRLEKLDEQPLAAPMPLQKPEIAAGTEEAFHAYISDLIFTRLSAGHSDWLAELRKVSLLFINLPDLNQDTDLESVQNMMRRIQGIVHRFEGSINKINVDDKGVTVDVAFGLPPFTHENDPVRCVRAALMIRSELNALGIRSSIGITTGRVFCGSIGNSERRQYTFLGDAVNLTARLAALGLRQLELVGREIIPILCDRPTYEAASATFEFEVLLPQQVKGKSGPVDIFHPLHEKKAVVRARAELVGRRTEQAALANALQELQQGAPLQVIIVRGEAGIGKSRLTEDLVRQAQNLPVKTFVGKGDGIEKSNPYYAWRPVFNRIFGIEELAGKPQFTEGDRLAIRAAVLSKLHQAGPELVRYAPLLGVVLPTSLPDNVFTAAMAGEIRGGNIREILLRLLQHEADQAPLLIVMEDLHWLDSASWTMLLDVDQKIRPVLLVLNTRPLPLPAPPEFDEILGKAETRLVELDVMRADDVEMIVCQRLGVRSIPAEVSSLIRQKSEGHPFFAEELAYTLRDSGILIIEGEQCTVAPDRRSLDRLELPDNLQATITSRIDSLNPVPQLALKVASVIGRIFTYRTLEAIHPIATDRPVLPQYMDVLTNLNLTLIESEAPDLAYIFKHALTQEVAYNLMLFAQRGQLHRAVAEWIESNHPEDLGAYYTLLAYHWTQAARSLEKATRTEDLHKALDYLEKAGDQSLNNFANAEAVQFFSQALELADNLDVGTLRLGQWYRKLADAYLGLGKLAEAKEYILRALSTLKLPIPPSDLARVGGVLAQVARQTGHRLRPEWFRRKALNHEQEAIRLEIVKLCQHLAVVQFLNGDPNPLPMLYAVLAGLNVAETMKDTPELWYMYSQMSAVCGFIPLRSQAQYYKDAWSALADKVYHPGYFVSGAISLATVESGNGLWQDVKDKIEKAITICEELGDHRQAGESIAFLTGNTLLEGGPAAAAAVNQRMWELAERRGNPIHTVWAYQVECPSLVWQGKLDECIDAAHKSIIVAEKAYVGEIPDAIVRSAMWLAMWLKGRRAEAWEEVKKALDKFARASVVDYSAYLIHAQLAEVAFLALEQARKDQSPAGQRREIEKYARQAIKNLKKYAAIFAIGEPALKRFSAELEWHTGKPEKAHALWQAAAAKAQALPMRYELGRAELALGQHLPVTDPERGPHLEKARQVFQQAELENWAALASSVLLDVT